MIRHSNTYTVESVTSGHPDKVCDQISDAILDECLRQDPMSRVAVETFGGHGLLLICGEVTTKAEVDCATIGPKVYADIGYTDEIEVITRVVRQSPDIAMGVNTGGAGDQGIMYGYATDETEIFLPKGLALAHQLAKNLEQYRRQDALGCLRPDGKTQVTMVDNEINTVLLSTQHTEKIDQKTLQKLLIWDFIVPHFNSRQKERAIKGDIKILINPTGQFIQGGFEADTGLTGRKLGVDTYGGLIPHGGGAFSGKDPTKVDRSAAYMARFAAKNLVAHGYGKEALVSVSYSIGIAEPLMIEAVNEKGENLAEVVKANFDFRPLAIIERLQLRRPIYQQTASYGHFGKPGLPWEEILKTL
ncbi:MAG: methionine adenosyltransferase [bacterium]|nr:methionine adenosyltransferase [bacterium]